MPQLGIKGCRRSRSWVRTTEFHEPQQHTAGGVERDFHAPAPNVMWWCISPTSEP